MEILDQIWEQIVPALTFFFVDLNWNFNIMLIVVLYGLKFTTHLDWFKGLFPKKAKKYTGWAVALITLLLYSLFTILDKEFSSEYLATLLRSMVVTMVFSNVLVDIPLRS